ncbi:C-terminal processing protease CtpA/Prc [Bradyrhizobium sp. USDA 3051]
MRKTLLFPLGALTGACLTLLVASPHGGVWAARAAASADDAYSKLNLFGEVFERVKASYVEKPDNAKLIEGAITGMVTSLDPHSRYMNDKAWTEMQETTSGEFGGLGIEVTMEEGLVKVVSPIDDTPASKAGIMSGDLISKIDGDAVQGMTLEQAVNKMKGPVETQTKLTIVRKGADAPLDVAIKREIIHVRPVRFHVENGDIGYIRVTSFNEQTTDGLKKAIASITKEVPPEKLVGYVMDLRNNPGRIARPGRVGVERVPAAWRGRLDPRPQSGRDPALYRPWWRPHQGQAAGGSRQRRLRLSLGNRGRRAA